MSLGKQDTEELLRKASLRPTRQRLALADLLFGGDNMHITAEELHSLSKQNGIHVSLATIYNNLHQFTEAGLLKEVSVNSSRYYFDTNTEPHHHFFYEDDHRLEDIPRDSLNIEKMPALPDGQEIEAVEVIIRIKNRTD